MTTLAIATDTATICIFDVQAMKHRLNDVGDWWSIPRNELSEVRNRNALFLNVGADGNYDVSVSFERTTLSRRYSLHAPSGRLFVGPGEQMTGGGLEPDVAWGGAFFDIVPGDYEIGIDRFESSIKVQLSIAAPFANEVSSLIEI